MLKAFQLEKDFGVDAEGFFFQAITGVRRTCMAIRRPASWISVREIIQCLTWIFLPKVATGGFG